MLAMLAARAVAASPSDATSHRAAREEAIRAIPWRQLAPKHRQAAELVVKGATLYRRLPTRVIDCDPEMFTFLVQHPEVIVDVWRLMGLSRVTLDRLPDGAYRGTDGAGTAGTIRYLHADWGNNVAPVVKDESGHHRMLGSRRRSASESVADWDTMALVLADGGYEGQPFVKPVRAQTLMLLRSGTVQESNGRHYITVRVDSFIRIEQIGLELVAKTVQPWITRTADHNLIETLTFVSNFSRTAETNPQGMQRLAARLTSVDESTRNELVALCYRAAERYASRTITPGTGVAIVARSGESTVNSLR